MVIAAAGIEAAASQLLPARNNAERLLRQAFLALVKELRGQPLPDASREALAEQFPALQTAPQQATAEPALAPRVDEVAELAAQLRSRHFGPDALDLAASFLEQLITSEPVAWCRSDAVGIRNHLRN